MGEIHAHATYFENGGEAIAIPLESDRAAWRVTGYPAIHADDLSNAAYIAHLPPPATAGKVAIDSGSEWELKAISGDAVLNAAGALTVSTIGGVAPILVDGSQALADDWDAGAKKITTDILDADTQIRLGTVDINAGGTLNNVAYLDQKDVFAAGLNTKVSVADVADPPTDAELDAAFGEPAALGAGFIGILDDNSGDADVYICYTSDGSWYYLKGTKAV